MADRSELYGAGLSYPFGFDSDGGAQGVGSVDSVRASLYRLFDTAPGEEFMNPNYGCTLKRLTFEQDTEVFRALAITAIKEAVARHEPRIAEVVKVELEPTSDAHPNTVYITTYFRLIQNQRVDNFVYPFQTGQ